MRIYSLRTWHSIAAILSLMFLPRLAVAAPERDVSHYVIGNSEVRTLPLSSNGHQYRLFVALPFDYTSAPEKRYPVLYTCDGNWSFVLFCGIYGGLYYDQSVPGFIVVGIGYDADDATVGKLRLYDYTPIRSPRDPEGKATGHASEFLNVVQHEIMPFVEREYRVDSSYRVLAGGSAGGLFTLYTMFTKPELFQGYIAVSPATDDASGLQAIERGFAEQKRPLPVRLFMSGASKEPHEFLEGILNFDAQLRARAYSQFKYEFRLVQGQGHGGTGPESFARGLRFVFEPLAPKK